MSDKEKGKQDKYAEAVKSKINSLISGNILTFPKSVRFEKNITILTSS